MKVIFVGTGCGVPSTKRASPSLIIKGDTEVGLFDAGPGSLRKLIDLGLNPNDIDYIFFTHLHVDHVGDLPAILFASKYPPRLRRKNLRLFGPQGLGNFYKNLIHLYGEQIVSSHYHVEIEEMKEEVPVKCGKWRISSITLSHTPNSIGYRVEDERGKTVAYSGDTEYCEGVIKLGKDVDLLILECSFPNNKTVPGHLTPSLAGRVAHEAMCKRLVLTHFYPECEGVDIIGECMTFYEGEIILAKDGLEIEV